MLYCWAYVCEGGSAICHAVISPDRAPKTTVLMCRSILSYSEAFVEYYLYCVDLTTCLDEPSTSVSHNTPQALTSSTHGTQCHTVNSLSIHAAASEITICSYPSLTPPFQLRSTWYRLLRCPCSPRLH